MTPFLIGFDLAGLKNPDTLANRKWNQAHSQ